MADIRPFRAILPSPGLEDKIAALPYDVYNREEAKEVVKKNPLSFLKIDRAETNFDDSISTYDECVYEKANELLHQMIKEKQFEEEENACYYIYRLTMEKRSQVGVVAVSSVDDYCNGIIKKHENTRKEKEMDRIKHIDACNAQTGPIFLAFRANQKMDDFLLDAILKKPLFDFISEDGIGHTVWKIGEEEDINTLRTFFKNTNAIYIADGHHRCASAVHVALERRKKTLSQESDYFLSVLFPETQLKIFDYNRVVRDYNGKSVEQIISEIEKFFIIKIENFPVKPDMKRTFGMFIDEKWYHLTLKNEYISNDPVEGLDVSILQKYVLDEVLGIKDPKTDKRIDFVGGIRGLEELEKRVHDDCKIAFSMYPTSIIELFEVADAGKLMPPKSTWFEPKLRSGLFIHKI